MESEPAQALLVRAWELVPKWDLKPPFGSHQEAQVRESPEPDSGGNLILAPHPCCRPSPFLGVTDYFHPRSQKTRRWALWRDRKDTCGKQQVEAGQAQGPKIRRKVSLKHLLGESCVLARPGRFRVSLRSFTEAS